MRLENKVIPLLAFSLVLLVAHPLLLAQGGRANAVPSGAKVNPPDPATKPLDARKRFAFDVVRAAVALPQSEPQDRLRVLAAAASVITPIRPALARSYSREGLRVEQDLIQRGEQPATSMLNSGPVDCKAVQTLVESIPAQRVDAAETTLVAAIGACPAVSSSAQKLIDGGLDEKKLAPRATLALMEQAGLHSAWSQDKFEKLFNSLPPDAAKLQLEAPNLAAMYARASSEVDHDVAKKTGLRLLLWLGKLENSGDRTVAVNVTTGAMKQVLGAKDYEDALASDVIARQVAQSAGGEGEISHPMDESVSVLKAMQSANEDRMQQLETLPPSQRAREASASGFASGTGGDHKLASRYFDLAFSSLNQMWSNRDTVRNAPAVVQEVSEAAAQVDSLDALRRARGLDDPTAQAIGMISVARVVASREPTDPTSASR
jgi:hypothetical protein